MIAKVEAVHADRQQTVLLWQNEAFADLQIERELTAIKERVALDSSRPSRDGVRAGPVEIGGR